MRTKYFSGLKAGARSNAKGEPVNNKILLSIPDGEYRRIFRQLEYIDLPSHLNLHQPHKKQKFVYFLNHGLASIVVAMRDDREVEAGVVGMEGAAGVAIAMGFDRSPLRLVMQIAGNGFKISAKALRLALKNAPNLQMRLHRYAVLQAMQVAQSAACNRLHETKPRLARWLLTAQDRVNSASLHITHDFLATMLGTDRSSLTIAAGALQRENAIQCLRGTVNILSRERLEKSVCECYGVIRQLNLQLDLN